jgi:hypothetical protein
LKPLVTTARALRELATGLAPEAIATSSTLVDHDTAEAEFLISVEDGSATQRILLIRDRETFGESRFVPRSLLRDRRAILSRMASFADRAKTLPLSLPRGWNQYKHDNLVTFFAVPNGDANSTRWIAELLPGDQADIVFWRTTTRGQNYDLEEFVAGAPRALPRFDSGWVEAIAAAREHLERNKGSKADVDMFLPPLEHSPARGRSYDEWMTLISSDQEAFISAPTDRSIRLRGPAGSGKTLALTLKAAREVLMAEKARERIRVLITTHSWALATQIQDGLDSMGLGYLDNVEVFPLLEVAEAILPQKYQGPAQSTLLGEDSYSGKRAQLDEIVDLLTEFVEDDWVTYRSGVTSEFSERVESEDSDVRLALAWDLLIEFGSVLGPAAIFPGAGSELRYLNLARAPWMLPLSSRGDLHVVYALYCRYMTSLERRSLVTPDQVLADFLNYLETHAWNRSRKSEGYDLVFVDEFHLFNPLERQVIHYLTRDVTTYPRVFMAVDPRQSPSEAFIGIAADSTQSLSQVGTEDSLGDVANFELTTVHRFTPQILNLVKHVHLEFPTLDFGKEWQVDLAAASSSREPGPVPQLIVGASRRDEDTDIYSAVRELYPRGRIAVAVVDLRQWARFSELAGALATARHFHVATISSRGDIEGLGYRRRGLVVGPAEYLAGLQFETVLVAGIPDMSQAAMPVNTRTRILSLLYLAMSRAEREVRIFTNEDDGGAPEVLLRGVSNGVLVARRGSLA